MKEQHLRMQRLGTYAFAGMLLAIGVIVFAVSLVSFAQYPTIGVQVKGSDEFREVLAKDYLSGALFGLLAVSTATVTFIRVRRKTPAELASTSSWPHWLLLLVVLILLVPMGIKDGNYPRIRIQGYIAVLFALRWGLAALRNERNRVWIVYCIIAVLLSYTMAALATQCMYGRPPSSLGRVTGLLDTVR